MDDTLLRNRDYTLIIAKTADDHPGRSPGFAQRWIAAQESVLMLSHKCEELDPDGITIYISCREADALGRFRKCEHVTSEALSHLIQDNLPPINLELKTVLQTAVDDYFTRRAAGKVKPNGEIIIVLLDGEPSDRMAVARTIKEATHKLEHEHELSIGFVQIGDDIIAQGYLTALDNHLKDAGAKFDIVDTCLLDTIEPSFLTEFLLKVLHD